MADGRITIDTAINSSGVDRGLKQLSEKMKKVGKSITSAGDTLTKKITTPAVAATSALAGITLVKGFNRLVGIDTAQAKLKGLGHDAKGVTKIMESALASVKGTSFGMDEAATTAANAVAAGVKPGKELTRYLSLTGDAAAIAGVSMAEMGAIINQVQTSQSAYTDNLNQLSDRGIPIYQWLGKEAGVAASEVKEMASKGKISSEMFIKAIEDNIGGAAQIMGRESFTASLSNIWASVSRIGANFLDAGGKGGGFFSTLKPMIADFNDRLGSLESIAANLGVKFGNAFNDAITKIKELKAMFDSLSPPMKSLILKVATISSAFAIGLGPALKIIGAMVTNFGLLSQAIMFLISPVGLVVAAITILVSALVAAYAGSETFRDIVNAAFVKIKEVALQVFGVVSSFIGEKIKQIKQFWDETGPSFLQAVKNVFNGIKAVVDFVMPAIELLIGFVWGTIKQIITGALDVIMGAVKIFSGLFTGDWSLLWDGVKQLLKGAVNLILGLMNLSFLGGIKKIFVNLGKAVFNSSKSMVTSVINFFKSLYTGAVKHANNLFTNVVKFFSNLLSRAKSIFGTLRTFGASVFGALRSTVVNIAKGIYTKVVGHFKSIYNGAKSAFNNVLNVAKSIFNKVKSTITNPIESAKKTVTGAIDKIKSAFSNMKVKIPMPHFNFSSGTKKIAGINIPYPKVNVDWYAKGGLFPANSPRMIGIGDNTQYQEAALPLSPSVLGMIGSKIHEEMPEGENAGSGNNTTVEINDMEATINIGGYQAKGLIKFITKEQVKEKDKNSRNIKGK